MPAMKEIYRKHSYEYDELVTHEDYRNNISAYLDRTLDFSGKTVLEFGCGTGRMTRLYIRQAAKACCFDGSSHMIERAQANLSEYGEKIKFGLCDNLDISGIGAASDVVIQGWSFGHTVSDNADRLEETVDKLVSGCRARLRTGGSILFFESLGTNTEEAVAPNDDLKSFFLLLEQKYNFERTVLRTDYKFDSDEEAVRIMGFFFGEEMGRSLKFIGEGIIREFTGAWHLKAGNL